MRFYSLLISLFSLLQCMSVNAQITLDSTELRVDTIATGLNIPWEIKWGPDGHIWTTERHGRVSRIDPVNKGQDVILDYSDSVHQAGESGMLGMELHLDFSTNPFVYIVYTYGSSSEMYERVSQFEYDGTNLVNESILIDSIPASTNHDGSRLLMLPDTTLLMTTGDAGNASLVQDPSSLSGKILRFHPDGSIPHDNPDPNSYVYSMGHRNAQGLLLHPNGKIYSSEHGPANDDEFQMIKAGRNYGWPEVEGYCDEPGEMTFCNDSNVVEPLKAWTPTIATSDIAYYEHHSIPEFEDVVIMAVLKDKRIVALRLNATGDQVIDEAHYLNFVFGRLRDLLVDPDGTVYIASNGDAWSNVNPFTHNIIAIQNADAVSLAEQTLLKFEIFPNPAADKLGIQGQLKGVEKFEIRDVQNKLLMSGAPEDENRLNIDIGHLSGGLYFFIMEKDGNRYHRKFIKE